MLLVQERRTILRINNYSFFFTTSSTVLFVVVGAYVAAVQRVAGDWMTPVAVAVFGICSAGMLAGHFGLWRRIRADLTSRRPRIRPPMTEEMRERLRSVGIEDPDTWEIGWQTVQRFEGRGLFVAVAQANGTTIFAKGRDWHAVRAKANSTGQKFYLYQVDPEHLSTPF